MAEMAGVAARRPAGVAMVVESDAAAVRRVVAVAPTRVAAARVREVAAVVAEDRPPVAGARAREVGVVVVEEEGAGADDDARNKGRSKGAPFVFLVPGAKAVRVPPGRGATP